MPLSDNTHENQDQVSEQPPEYRDNDVVELYQAGMIARYEADIMDLVAGLEAAQ